MSDRSGHSDNEPGEGTGQQFTSPYLTHFVGRRFMSDEAHTFLESPERESAQYNLLRRVLQCVGSRMIQTLPRRMSHFTSPWELPCAPTIWGLPSRGV